MFRHLVSFICASVVWFLTPWVVSVAADATAPNSLASWELKIEKILDQKLSEPIAFVETPLLDVMQQLSATYQIPILLDLPALDELGISGATPVTIRLNDITLRSAFHLMLRELELTYLLKDEVLLITIPEVADEELITRVYAVGDLVKVYPWQKQNTATHYLVPDPMVPGLDWEVPQSDTEISGQAPVQFADSRNGFEREYSIVDRRGKASRLDPLIDLIRSVIAPESWNEVGGPGSIGLLAPDLMVVVNTRHIHEEISSLLHVFRLIPPLHEQEPGKVYPFLRHGQMAEARINTVLDERVSLDWIETPLTEIIDFLKEKHHLEIQIDQIRLQELGLAKDDLVTIELKDVTLRSALRWILRDLGLTYIIKNEILLITTHEYACEELLVISYPVGDLVRREYADDGTLIELDFGSLIRAIQMIGTDSWYDVGGLATIVPFEQRGLLVVFQTQNIHAEIAELFSQMRALGKPTEPWPAAEKPDPAEIVVRRYSWPDGGDEDREQIRDEIEPMVRVLLGSMNTTDSYVVFLPDRIIIRGRRDAQVRIQRFLKELHEYWSNPDS